MFVQRTVGAYVDWYAGTIHPSSRRMLICVLELHRLRHVWSAGWKFTIDVDEPPRLRVRPRQFVRAAYRVAVTLSIGGQLDARRNRRARSAPFGVRPGADRPKLRA